MVRHEKGVIVGVRRHFKKTKGACMGVKGRSAWEGQDVPALRSVDG